MGGMLPRRSGSKDAFLETAWRYRGVALLVSIPVRATLAARTLCPADTTLQVLLLAMVFLFMPRSPPPLFDAVDSAPGGAGGRRRYAVVVDAGSTGSRVHAFAFADTPAGLELLGDTFEQLKPGLSSYAGDPSAGAASLRPLLDAALAAVPASHAARTPVEVRATAGLRMLPGDQAEELLAGASVLCA